MIERQNKRKYKRAGEIESESEIETEEEGGERERVKQRKGELVQSWLSVSVKGLSELPSLR